MNNSHPWACTIDPRSILEALIDPRGNLEAIINPRGILEALNRS